MVILLVRLGWYYWVDWRNTIYAREQASCLLAIDVPRDNEQTPKAVEQIFSHLSGAYSSFDRYEKYWLGKFLPTFSFEIVSIGGYIQFLVRCPTRFRDLVEAAFYAQYPGAEIVEVADYADKVPMKYPDPEWDVFGTELVLKKPEHLPIRTYMQFEHGSAEDPFKDPLSHLLEVMGSLKKGEQLWLQYLLVPTDDSWKEKGEEEVAKILGKNKPKKKGALDSALEAPKWVTDEVTDQITGARIFGTGADPADKDKKDKKDDQFRIMNLSPGEKGVLEAAQMKLSKVALKTKCRMIYIGKRDMFSKGRVVPSFKGAMTQFSALNMNGLKLYGPVTPRDDYFYDRWGMPGKQMAVLQNYINRSGDGARAYMLNTEELATLYHFPMLTVKAPAVKKVEAKRAEPPAGLPTEEMLHGRPFEEIKPEPEEPELGDVEEEEDEGAPPENLPFA